MMRRHALTTISQGMKLDGRSPPERDFQTDMPDNVTQGYEFISYIKLHTEPVLSDEQAEYIINTIDTIRLEDSKETDKKHVDYVRSKN